MLISLMLIVYILLGIYILWRMIHWLKRVVPLFKHKRMQSVLILLYLAFASTIILGEMINKGRVQVFIKKLGDYWIGTFVYIILFIVLADIIVLLLKFINRKKEISILKQEKRYYIIGIFVIICSFVFSMCGFIHARNIKARTYNINVNKQVKNISSLKIALVADLHMGYSIGPEMIQKMVDNINENDPDVVVIAGDIFNNDYEALQEPERLQEILSSIKSKYGVYAVYGNHDVSEKLVGGFSLTSKKLAFRDKRMKEFLLKSNIDIIEDQTRMIADDSIYLVGRLDGEKSGDGTSNRMSIEDLTEDLDKDKPIIDIEHEPTKLNRVANSGVDIMLSGHTHAGQFFPLTLIQPLVWENYNGLLKKGNMYSFVTSGVGVYGPYMRLFTDSEVMIINVNFSS